ncbi:MAG: Lar family restriction alleviation protein [Treponema sp.]|jgi:hypothetical protein|nr:Lar family restriction alleviation protein [Treponema sp.]
MNEVLKLCPFCGEKPMIISLPDNHLHSFAVGCQNEKCNARVSGATMEDAIDVWNERVTDEATN